nr:galactoside alpha-(1,2)-fucosyltransferase 1-like [Cherax quadricarinatus]
MGTLCAVWVDSFLKEIFTKAQNESHVPPVLVGIHVRRTDYVDFIRNYEGRLPGEAYFRRAMQYFRDKFRRVIFVVASDGTQYATEKFAHYPDVTFSPGTTWQVDLATLASCNHSIISLGSYGFWTGYLTGGQVLYPSITFGKTCMFSREWYTLSRLKRFIPISAD